MNKFKEWIQKQKDGNHKFKKDQLLIVILSGVLLLVVALPTGSGGTAKEKKSTKQATVKEEMIDNNEKICEISPTEEFVSTMENRLEQVLCNVESAGKVKVVITLKSSEEKIVEKDIPVNRSNTEEKDSQGGERTVSNVDTKESTVYISEDGSTVPYVVKTMNPEVEGVVVLCEGAGKGEVKKNITEAIEVLFGIEPHKIVVLKMKSS